MTRYALDAPTLVHIVDEDVLIHASHQLVAPNRIRSDALQLLLDDVRGGKRSEAEALARHDKMTELKMRLLGDRVSRRTAWRIARDQQWESLRDAEYLAIAQLQADAFVTVSRGMAVVAGTLVRVVPVEDLVVAG